MGARSNGGAWLSGTSVGAGRLQRQHIAYGFYNMVERGNSLDTKDQLMKSFSRRGGVGR